VRPLTLLALAVLLLPGLAWGPLQPLDAGVKRQLRPLNAALGGTGARSERPKPGPQGYVEAAATRYGVPVPLALAVWQMESSQAVRVRDGRAKERGAFQVTEAAATDMGCNWRAMRRFRASVDCGMAYLASSLEKCRTPLRAAHRYNRGHCPHNGKVWGYAQQVGLLMMNPQGRG